MVAYVYKAYNPSVREAEVGGMSWVKLRPAWTNSKTPSQIKNQKNQINKNDG